VYFDKQCHNLTTARLWWDLYKGMFDSRERLMSHVFKVISKPVKNIARKVHKPGSALRRSEQGGTGGPPGSGAGYRIAEEDDGGQTTYI
jgi:hypothetical protein